MVDTVMADTVDMGMEAHIMEIMVGGVTEVIRGTIGLGGIPIRTMVYGTKTKLIFCKLTYYKNSKTKNLINGRTLIKINKFKVTQ